MGGPFARNAFYNTRMSSVTHELRRRCARGQQQGSIAP
jgi:hypothetical protein